MGRVLWLAFLLLILTVPASALHDTPTCQGTVTGYILVGQPRGTETFYLFMSTSYDARQENVICTIPGSAKVTVIVQPGKQLRVGL
jgi:hypothetical protein